MALANVVIPFATDSLPRHVVNIAPNAISKFESK